MRVDIRIQHDGLDIQISDETEADQMLGGDDILLAEQWDNGTPLELIEAVTARAVAAYKGKINE